MPTAAATLMDITPTIRICTAAAWAGVKQVLTQVLRAGVKQVLTQVLRAGVKQVCGGVGFWGEGSGGR
jgi:hypothetical protein